MKIFLGWKKRPSPITEGSVGHQLVLSRFFAIWLKAYISEGEISMVTH